MRIAVLMTCFNRRETTLECLRHLERSIRFSSANYPLDVDVWLNDDGSTDGTGEAVADWSKYVDLRPSKFKLNLIHGSGSDYWCGGMRRAWQAAVENRKVYDAYLWLNDDTLINEYAVGDLLAVDGDIVCGAIEDPDTAKCAYGGYDAKNHLVEPNGFPQRLSRITGNLVLVRKRTYDSIGMFRSCWTHAIGDCDYGITANEVGLNVVLSPRYLGSCKNDNQTAKWMDSHISFIGRWKNLHSPKGYSEPWLFFYYNSLHFGLFRAVRLWIQQYVRVLFPWIWERYK